MAHQIFLTTIRFSESLLRIHLNTSNAKSYNSKYYLSRINCLVPSEFTSKPLQESSNNSNFHDSKNCLNGIDYLVPWRIFYQVIRILIKKFYFSFCLGWCHSEQNWEDITFEFSYSNVLNLSTVYNFYCFEVKDVWNKVACVLCSKWPQKESMTKWL